MEWVLASASPRRLELLRGIGVAPRVLAVDVDERLGPDERPADAVRRLARTKGLAALDRGAGDVVPSLVLAADTLVVVDGTALGKPVDADEAGAMLRRLRGRDHQVLTGVWICRTLPHREAGCVAVTRVRFRDVDDRQLDAYVATGEPLGKAGAYAIQERGALLVESIDGSWSNVVGLPLEQLPALTEALGLHLVDVLHPPPLG